MRTVRKLQQFKKWFPSVTSEFRASSNSLPGRVSSILPRAEGCTWYRRMKTYAINCRVSAASRSVKKRCALTITTFVSKLWEARRNAMSAWPVYLANIKLCNENHWLTIHSSLAHMISPFELYIRMESLQKASRNSVKTSPDKSETHAIWGADQEGSDIAVWCVETLRTWLGKSPLYGKKVWAGRSLLLVWSNREQQGRGLVGNHPKFSLKLMKIKPQHFHTQP